MRGYQKDKKILKKSVQKLDINPEIKKIEIERLIKYFTLENEYTNIFEEYISSLAFLTRI